MALTKLQAVNIVLRGIHEAQVSALDTGNESVTGWAEVYLDEADEAIQSEGWTCNTEYDIDVDGADTTKQAMVIAAGTWTVATLTLTKTAAFASYTWAYGDELYVSGGTGVTAGWYRIASKTSDNAIVMAESIATANAADITTTLIGWEDGIAVPSDILAMDTDGSDEYTPVEIRGGMLYDTDDDTFNFSGGLTVRRVRQLAFTSLPLLLQRYIVARAAVEFQRRMVQGDQQDEYLLQELDDARRKWLKYEDQQADTTCLNDDFAHSILGTGYTTNPARYK